MRPIDADKLFSDGIPFGSPDDPEGALRALIDKINNAPTVTVKPVQHGKWIAYPDGNWMKCSVCGMEYQKFKMPQVVGYCPNPCCGAKMDEDGNF